MKKITDTIYHFEHGYFVKENNTEWVFVPFEKSISLSELQIILNKLYKLHEDLH